MREIKFRAKVVKDIQVSSEGFIPAGEWITWYPLAWVPGWTESIDKASVSQYTGLKDKNGVEIYEGDIVRSQRRSDHYDLIYYEVQMPTYKAAWFLHTVALHHKHEGWKDISRGGYVDMYLSAKYDGDNCFIEVIGNIHENPELLEVTS